MTTGNLNDLKELYKIEDNKHLFHLTFKYDRIKKLWTFMGYRCLECDNLYINKSTVSKHDKGCGVIKSKRKRRREFFVPYIVCVDGKTQWTSFLESNQNLPKEKT